MINESATQAGLKILGIVLLIFLYWLVVLLGEHCPGLAAKPIASLAGLFGPPILTIAIIAPLARWAEKREEKQL